jgi:hypothetical protein
MKPIILATVLFFTSFAYSSQFMLPEYLSVNSAEVSLGRGYFPKTLEVSVGGCATGNWNVTRDTTPVIPFEKPIYYKMKTGISVVYTAVSSERENRSIKPYQFRNEPVCGQQYVSSVVLGAKLSLVFNYWVAPEQVYKLEEFLKSHLQDMHTVFDANPAHAGIKLNGFGLLYSGSGVTDKLIRYNNSCRFSNKDCDLYLAEAYDQAENLNLPKSNPLVDVISFTVDDYPAP